MADNEDIEQLEQDADAPNASVDPSAPPIAPEADNSANANSPVPPQDNFGESLMPSVMHPEGQAPVTASTVAVPTQESADNSDEDDNSESSASAAPKASVNPQISKAVDSAIQNPEVRQYMKDKYGFGSELDDAALKAAQSTEAQDDAINLILRGGQQIGKGFAQSGAGPEFQKITSDSSGLDAALKANQAPVQNILARRQGLLQDQAFQQDQMKGQALQSQLQSELALSDPASPESKAAQKAYLPILQKAGLDTSLLQNASANTIKTVLQQPLEFADKQKQAELIHQDAVQMKNAQIEANNIQRDFNNNFKVNEFNDKLTKGAQESFNKDPQRIAAAKANDGIDSALTTLELAKTNPTAYQASNIDIAKAVVGGAGKLNAKEFTQMAQGNPALAAKYAQVYKQLVSGTITPENYANGQQLLQAIKDRNNAVIEKRGQTIAGQLSTRNHKDANSNLQTITGNPNASITSQPAASQQSLTPQDQQAITWAQANPNDPRAAKILQLHGM